MVLFAFIPWLSGLFTSLFGFVGVYFTAKVAFAVAFVASIAILVAAFVLVIERILSSIEIVSPPMIQVSMSILPNNLSACLSAYFSAQVAIRVYEYKTAFVERMINQGL